MVCFQGDRLDQLGTGKQFASTLQPLMTSDYIQKQNQILALSIWFLLKKLRDHLCVSMMWKEMMLTCLWHLRYPQRRQRLQRQRTCQRRAYPSIENTCCLELSKVVTQEVWLAVRREAAEGRAIQGRARASEGRPTGARWQIEASERGASAPERRERGRASGERAKGERAKGERARGERVPRGERAPREERQVRGDRRACKRSCSSPGTKKTKKTIRLPGPDV